MATFKEKIDYCDGVKASFKEKIGYGFGDMA